MRDGIKKYLIGFTVGIIIVVICILASQRAEAFTNIYAWVTNGAGENVYSGGRLFPSQLSVSQVISISL